MKKKFFITLLAFFVTLSANALEKIKYDNLKLEFPFGDKKEPTKEQMEKLKSLL